MASRFPKDIDRLIEEGQSLDSIHDKHVVLTRTEQKSYRKVINQFVTFLQSRFEGENYSVAKVVKNGSLGKGTATRVKVDIDLVVYFNGIRRMRDFRKIRAKLLTKIQTKLKSNPWDNLTFVKKTRFSVSYKLDGHDVDILPAFDVLEVYGGPSQVYRNHRPSPYKARLAQQYSASLAQLQVEFVKGSISSSEDEDSDDDDDQNGDKIPVTEPLKRVIRLLKYWKKSKKLNIRSYTLELIAIFAARQMKHFETSSLFLKVMEMLASQHLQVVFDDNYNIDSYEGRPSGSYVLDPANPYMNTLAKTDMYEVTVESANTLQLLRRVGGAK